MAEQPGKQGSDEIDLGHVLLIIGQGISKLLKGIQTLFQGLLDCLQWLFLFIKRRFFYFVTSAVIGLIVGVLLDSYKGDTYVSKMVVEPNFNSSQQLYNNIEFYNELARSKDSVTLSRILEISPEEAASLTKLQIDSYSDENQKVKLFDDFISTLDTTTLKTIDYAEYLKNFNSFDARFHLVTVIGKNKTVAKKSQNAIIGSISGNEYFQLQKSINDENIVLQENILNKQLVEIDSLLILYQRVMMLQAQNPLQGTNINLADNNESQNKEIALLEQRKTLKQELVRLNQQKANKKSIVNVISDFPAQGVQHKGLLVEFKYLFPFAMIGLTLAILLVLEVNRALSTRNTDPNESSS